MLTSTRFQVNYPSPTRGDTADVPRDFGSVVVGLETAAMYGQGTFASRPVSTGGSPGIQGRFYMATDLTPMILYYDYGTGWASIGAIAAGSIGTTQLADGAVTGGPAGAGVKIAALTITHDNIAVGTIRGGGNEIAAASVTAADLAAALKPSGGAGAGTEALRAIGTGAGLVAPGTHAAQHAPAGADPIDYTLVHVSGTLVARPAAAAGNAGLFYYATDQDAFYRSTGAAWVRVGAQAGDLFLTMNVAALTGRVLLQGQDISRVGIFADLFARWGTTYGVGDGSTTFGLPDARGRTPVAKGTHADVSTIGNNDGVAVASRRPKHQTDVTNMTVVGAPGVGSLAVVGAPDAGTLAVNGTDSHGNPTGGSGSVWGNGPPTSPVSGAPGIGSLAVGGAPTVGSLDVGGAGGPAGTAPVDSGAYLVTQLEAKL